MDSYIIKHAFRHFLPAAILTGIILQVRIITDCIVVGHLIGPDAVSAINLYIPLEEIVYSFLCILMLGASFLGAECVGRQDYRGASHYFTVSLAGTGTLAAILVALTGIFFHPVVSLLAGGEDSLIHSYTFTYTLYMLPTFLVMAPNGVLRYFTNIDGKPRLVMISILTSFLLNPVLDYVLIRFAGLGMAGAALATLTSDLAGLGILTAHFLGKRHSFQLRLPPRRSRVLRNSIRMGIPLSSSLFLMAIVCVILNRTVLHFQGAEGMFVWAVATQIIAVCEMFLEGITDMNQSIGGTLLGSCDFRSFHAYLRRSLRFVQFTMVAVTALMLLFPGFIYTLFGADGSLATDTTATRPLRIMALYLFPYIQLSFYENVHSMVQRERLSLLFQVLLAAGMTVFPFLAGQFCPSLFWWTFPLLAFLLCIAQLASTQRIQHREKNVRAPFLEDAFPADVEADFTVEYNQASVDATMVQIRTVADLCELPGGKGMLLTLCCEELMNNLLMREPDSPGRFEVRIVDKSDLTRVIFKAAGKPFNPVIRFDDTAWERSMRGEPLQLELELVNKSCDDINHHYLYGVNVTVLEFRKA